MNCFQDLLSFNFSLRPYRLGLPVDSDSNTNSNSNSDDKRKGDDGDRPGRFLHAEAASLRMADVPAMLAVWACQMSPSHVIGCHVTQQARVPSGRSCSPRHRMPCNSINEGSKCVAFDDVASNICQALSGGAAGGAHRPRAKPGRAVDLEIYFFSFSRGRYGLDVPVLVAG
jgi:hypothetical protein